MTIKETRSKQVNPSKMEFFVSIEIQKEFMDEEECAEYADNLENRILILLDEDLYDVYTNEVCGNTIQVRSEDITPDEKGISLLLHIYSILEENLEDVSVCIGVHTGTQWLRDQQGQEYNEELIPLDDFLSNLDRYRVGQLSF